MFFFMSLENLPLTATLAFRSYSQHCFTSKITSGTHRARNLWRSSLEFTLSKDSDTSEQHIAIFRRFANMEIHVNTNCDNASRARRSGIYANWFRPYASRFISLARIERRWLFLQLCWFAMSNWCFYSFQGCRQTSVWIEESPNAFSITLAIFQTLK